MKLPIGEYLRQWIELHTTEGQTGKRPLLLEAGRKSCPCCEGLALFGRYRGHAMCKILNDRLHANECAKNIHTLMDEDTTRNMCKVGGRDCPLRPYIHKLGKEKRT